jgi:hypothetical protein
MRSLRTLVLVGVLLTVATLAVGPLAGEVPSCATGSVIELEIAATQDRAVELIGACDEAGLDVLRDGLRADTFGFLPLYVLAVSFWCVVGTRRLPWSTSLRRRLVQAGVVVIVLAGLFDLVENHYLGDVVDAAGASDAIGTATAASAVKWALVFYAVPASVVAMVRSIRAVVRPAGETPS